MLITSISGIRGTIGGKPGENLTPVDVVSFASAYAFWILQKTNETPTIIVGRDGRKSGDMILGLIVQTLIASGINVVNCGLATTPTVEMEVIRNNASGGIIVTASHNPKEYNGIKMLNADGEFLSAESGAEILAIAESKEYQFKDVDSLGKVQNSYNHHLDHIQDILNLDLVDADLVASRNYKVSLDAINSVGGIAVPLLLEKMGVETVGLYCEPNGDFQHRPEPLEENLGELKSLVVKTESFMGIAVDPDVDRLVMIDENGDMINEEYTIVIATGYVLSETPGPSVSNLSSSRALKDITEGKYHQEYYSSAVGEKNVVEKMKDVNAVIGGEGSGGVIYPELHYGRDALVGIALILTYLAKRDISLSALRSEYPDYFMSKQKITLPSREKIGEIIEKLKEEYKNEKYSKIDGLKIEFDDSWVQIRASNTEPILRIYTEAQTQVSADELASLFVKKINQLL